MAVEYLEVKGITDACKAFQDKIKVFDSCVLEMDSATNDALRSWVGKGRNQFETQMNLMKSQLEDISEVLYEIYDALVDAEAAYIDEDEAVSKQFETVME